jgi:hypothetical protein
VPPRPQSADIVVREVRHHAVAAYALHVGSGPAQVVVRNRGAAIAQAIAFAAHQGVHAWIENGDDLYERLGVVPKSVL